MTRYRFEGFAETILSGLQHGVNAVLHRDGHGQLAGSTVVAEPGDEVTTSDPYEHAHMACIDETATPPAAPPAEQPLEQSAPTTDAADAATTQE